jgi:hypothetical protein
MANDTTKIAKAVADEIELRELQKELKIKEEINEHMRRRNEFLSKLGVIAFLSIAVSVLLYFAYTLNAPRSILIGISIYVGVAAGISITILIDAIMDYKEGN